MSQSSLPSEYTESPYAPSGGSPGQGLVAPIPSRDDGKKPVNVKGVTTSPEMRYFSRTLVTSSNVSPVTGPDKRRKALTIQNVGTADVYLGFGTIPNVNGNNSVLLVAGSVISFDAGYAPNNEINAVSVTQGRLAILEGVFANG